MNLYKAIRTTGRQGLPTTNPRQQSTPHIKDEHAAEHEYTKEACDEHEREYDSEPHGDNEHVRKDATKEYKQGNNDNW